MSGKRSKSSKLDVHEAVCAERYEELKDVLKKIDKRFESMESTVNSLVSYKERVGGVILATSFILGSFYFFFGSFKNLLRIFTS